MHPTLCYVNFLGIHSQVIKLIISIRYLCNICEKGIKIHVIRPISVLNDIKSACECLSSVMFQKSKNAESNLAHSLDKSKTKSKSFSEI